MNKKIHLKKLDSLRGFAAFYVLLHNFVYGLHGLHLVAAEWKILFFAGQETVMLFFIISGFVIYLSTVQRNLNFRDYFIRRFRRIYVLLLLSFLISLAVFAFNQDLNERFSWQELGGNLLLLQDFGRVKPGSWFTPFLGNLPLWSLSYEWWFYMLFFPIYKYIPPKHQLSIITIFSGICYLIFMVYPNHICLVGSYLIVWWCGVQLAIYFITNKVNFQLIKRISFSLISMIILSLIPFLQAPEIKFGVYPFLIFRHFVSALLIIWIGFFWIQNHLIGFNQLLGRFAKLAPISYAIYIFHFPILIQWRLHPFISNYFLEYSFKFCLLLLLAYLAEIKLQPLINQWLK